MNRQSHAFAAFAAAALVLPAAANAIPQPPHDQAGNGVACTDCHAPYGSMNDPGESQGAVTAGSGTTSLQDSTKTWDADEWKGGVISITSGANAGEFREVISNSATGVNWELPLPQALSVGDQYKLGRTTYENIETKCKSCHNPTGQASSMPEVGLHSIGGGEVVGCGKCHDPHNIEPNSGQGNGLLRDTPRWPSANGAVAWPSGGANPFIKGAAPYNGVCEVCHTQTSYHRNNAAGDHSHNAGIACTTCHTHDGDFAASGGCTDCHNQPQGARRQIAGGGGDFARTSHHVTGTVTDGDCVECHFTGSHQQGTVKLKDPDAGDAVVYSYNPSDPTGIESFCLNCHDADGAAAGGGTVPFSDGQTVPDVKGPGAGTWASAAHKTRGFPGNGGQPLTCMGNGGTNGCHDNGHGSSYIKLMAAGPAVDNLCDNCHSGNGHASGVTYMTGFSLACTSCHNAHVVTGKSTEPGFTPLTRPDFSAGYLTNPRAVGKTLWGAVSGQKMDDYAGSGTYRTPAGDTMGGDELFDYPTFCLSCHSQNMSPSIHGNISWSESHGTVKGNSPADSGGCPNWYDCGMARSWDGDNCSDIDPDSCWPVISRGLGEEAWTRDAYTQLERLAGANFVLSCSDCHVTHEGGVGRKLRGTINGAPGSTDYSVLCNACHWRYNQTHAGMSGCGNAGCHNAGCVNGRGAAFCDYNTLHGQSRAGGPGGDRIVDTSLVADFRFEGNLSDSGPLHLHGTFRVTAGGFAAGRFGNALDVNDDPVEIGTTDSYWSTDDGAHGTWRLTEMKKHMTLEAWVYPTASSPGEQRVLAKHTYGNGGYTLELKQINGAFRAALLTNVNGGDSPWRSSDCNGLRGAFSRSTVPLNQWTHIAAIYDRDGPDRNPADGSVGRTRIFVNGEDVTDSYSDVSACYTQPGPGENDMFPHSDWNDIDPSMCYEGTWCASALSIGGMNWSAPTDNFIGRIDEVKVWNVTKDAAYFSPVDANSPPRIEVVTGMAGSAQLDVTFSEGVFTNPGASGALTVSDFSYTDSDNGRTVVGVSHTAGASTAVLTLNSPLDGSNDLFTDTLSAVSNGIYDEYSNAAGTTAVTVTASSACPSSPVVIALNEPPGSTSVTDSQAVLYGAVAGSGTLTGSAYQGDGAIRYIDFEYNTACLKATTAMTIETRINPTGLSGTGNYVRRILARDAGGNYQTSVWRNNTWNNYSAPSGVASIALWVRPADQHGGNAWKPVLTDYGICPIVSDHWYQIREVWNTNKPGGTPGSPFVPADIFMDDQGTDGAGLGEMWSGEQNCTHASQTYHGSDSNRLYTGDQILPADGAFVIGANVSNHANNVFNGLIDFITWSDTAN